MATIPLQDKDGNADGTLELKAQRTAQGGLCLFVEDANSKKWPLVWLTSDADFDAFVASYTSAKGS